MAQNALAIKSGVRLNLISGLENGVIQVISSKALVAIAQALETTVDQIFFSDQEVF